MDPIYLDHHTATPIAPSSLDVFMRSSKDCWGAVSSPHFVGQQLLYPLKKNLEKLFEGLGMNDKDELFVSSGSAEGIYHVFFHTYIVLSRATGRSLFVTTQGEESATIQSLQRMEQLGCSVKKIPLNKNGQITREALSAAISSRTALVSFSWVNGLTGVIQPLFDLVEECREKGVWCHIDASYMFGKSSFRFQDLGVQFLTLEGAIIQAPHGTGLTLALEEVQMKPLIPGKEEGAIAPLGALYEAVMEANERFEHMCLEVGRLRDRFEERIIEAFPGAVIIGKGVDRVPNCSAIAFPGVYSESLLYLLNAKGVYATIGGGRFQKLESLLLLQGEVPSVAQSAVSFAFGSHITEEEIERAVEVIVASVKQLALYSRPEDR